MDDYRLDRIEKKLDDTNSHLINIDMTLNAQHLSLKEHMRRTSALEKKVEPLEQSMLMLSGVIKFLKLLGILTGIVELIRLFK